MDNQSLLDGINKLGPWFHRIDFKDGVSTKSGAYTGEDNAHPLPTWKRISPVLPQDLSGKTVLDIGCNAGFYSFKARERNAKRVLGLDAQLWHVRQARFAAQGLGHDRVEFRQGSVYDLTPEKVGKHDVVLALGLIYHLKHLYQALENLYWVTKELLVIETAIIPTYSNWPTTSNYGVDNKPMEAIGVIGNAWNEPEPPCNWFIPTPNAVKVMLESVGFSEVKIENVTDTRSILSARKKEQKLDSRTPFGIGGKLAVFADKKVVNVGETSEASVVVSNTGRAHWLSPKEDDEGGVYLTGIVTKEDEPLYEKNLEWSALPVTVKPREALSIDYKLPAFEKPGNYDVEFYLLAKGVGTFQTFGVSAASLRLTVA